MDVSEIEVHRYHISLVSGSISYKPSGRSRAPKGDLANIHPALLDPTLSVPGSSTSAPFASTSYRPGASEPKKRKRKPSAAPFEDNTFQAPPPLLDGSNAPVSRISEADLMAFHQSHAHLFSSASRPSISPKAAARGRPGKSSSPSKTFIPLSSPSHRPAHVVRPPPPPPPAPLVPYSSSTALQCSSSFDGALTGSDDWQDAMDEEEVDELATVPRPPVRRRKAKEDDGTPTGAARIAMKSKGGAGRLAELRGEGVGMESPLKALKRVNTPLKPNGDAGILPGTKKKEKKTKPVWQVNTPEAGYGSRS